MRSPPGAGLVLVGLVGVAVQVGCASTSRSLPQPLSQDVASNGLPAGVAMQLGSSAMRQGLDIADIALSGDGRRLLAVYEVGATLWDVGTGEAVWTMPALTDPDATSEEIEAGWATEEHECTAPALNGAGDVVVLSCEAHSIVFDLATGDSFALETGLTEGHELSKDGGLLLVRAGYSSGGRTRYWVEVWDLQQRGELFQSPRDGAAIFTADGTEIIVARGAGKGDRRTVDLLDVDDGSLIRRLLAPTDRVVALGATGGPSPSLVAVQANGSVLQGSAAVGGAAVGHHAALELGLGPITGDMAIRVAATAGYIATAGRDDGGVALHRWPPRPSRSLSAFAPTRIVASADGRTLAAAEPFAVTPRVWRLPEGRLATPALGPTGPTIALVALGDDSSRVLSATLHGELHVWDTSTGGVLASASLGPFVEDIAASPDGSTLSVMHRNGRRTTLVKTADLQTLATLEITAVDAVFGPDGDELWLRQRDGLLRHVSRAPLAEADEPRWELTAASEQEVFVAAMARAGARAVAWVGAGGRRRRVDLATGLAADDVPLPRDAMTRISGSPDGLTWAFVDTGRNGHGALRVTSARPGASPVRVAAEGWERTAVSADGRFAVGGTDDGMIVLADTTAGVQGPRRSGHRAPVSGLTFLADGRIASASTDGVIYVWACGSLGTCRK